MKMELLKELCTTPGVSGREERLRAIVRREVGPLVDEIRADAMGNLICLRRGGGQKKLMIAAHLDEIGFLVTHIDDKGFLRLVPVGGHDPRNMVAQRVVVCGRQDLPGILYPSSKPPHLQEPEERDKTPKHGAFFVDVGLPAAQVRETVAVGDPVTISRDFAEVGESLSCKAMDNRLALYIMIEAVRRAARSEFDVYAVATSQEEVGVRGATVTAYEISPDVGLALDVTIAADLPDMPDHEQVTRLGHGTAIKIMDGYSISNPRLVSFLRDLATQRQIPYQMEILPRGGTDAGAVQRIRSGVPVVTISRPTRYVHSSVEMVHRTDIEASIALTAAFIEEGHRGEWTLE
jgi:tetrahedral aminopeptidase